MIEQELVLRLELARDDGKTIGLVQGSWDLFHLGHLLYIKKAKSLCDFLIIAMDDDEKIRKRKGPNRPIIPLEERYRFVEELGIANGIVVKSLGEPKWGTIKRVKPDVLIVIAENYTDEEIAKLEEICGKVAVLPRQSRSSTSEKIRQAQISGGVELREAIDEAVDKVMTKWGFIKK